MANGADLLRRRGGAGGSFATPDELLQEKGLFGRLDPSQAQTMLRETISPERIMPMALMGMTSGPGKFGKYPIKQVDVNSLPVRGVGMETGAWKAFEADLKKRGIVTPIIIDKKTKMVWDGVHRVDFARTLGMRKVPAIEINARNFTRAKLDKLIKALIKKNIISLEDLK